MPANTCPKCGKHFTDKNYAKHIARKIPCEPKKTKKINVKKDIKEEVREEIKDEVKEDVKEEIKEEVKDNEGEKFLRIFKEMEQVLYLDGIVGEKARNDIITILILTLLEEKFKSGEIDIFDVDKYQYGRPITKDNIKFCLVSELANENKEENLRNRFEDIWQNVLCMHEITSKFCNKNNFISVIKDKTLLNLVKIASKL